METIQLNEITINRESYDLIFDGIRHILPRKEFELLYLLASKPSKVFTREEIIELVWKKNPIDFNDRSIDVHIRKLRIKLQEKYIHTIKGVGYRLLK